MDKFPTKLSKTKSYLVIQAGLGSYMLLLLLTLLMLVPVPYTCDNKIVKRDLRQFESTLTVSPSPEPASVILNSDMKNLSSQFS